MEFLYSSLSFVCGAAFTLGALELYHSIYESKKWEKKIADNQRAYKAESEDPVRKKVRLDRYV